MYRSITGGLIVSRPPELHVEILLGFLLSTIVSGPPTCILRKEILLLSLSSTVSGPLALRMEILMLGLSSIAPHSLVFCYVVLFIRSLVSLQM